MDRNSIIGIILITFILIGYSIWTSPSAEQIAKIKREKDSIAQLEAHLTNVNEVKENLSNPTSSTDDTLVLSDSLVNVKLLEKFGSFANAAIGTEEYYTVENDLLKLKIASKGGRVVYAEAKKFHTYDTLPLVLFTEESSTFSFNFPSGGKEISTQDLIFVSETKQLNVNKEDSSKITLRASLSNDKYIEYEYGIKGNSYLIDYNVRFVGINEYIAKNQSSLQIDWSVNIPSTEKGIKNQRENTTVYYKYPEEHPDYINEAKDETEEMEEEVEWVAMKSQFFSSIFITDRKFNKNASSVTTKTDEKSDAFVKNISANLSIPFAHNNVENYDLQFYFGPNDFEILKSHGGELFRIIPLGIGIFNWVNRFFIMPIFNGLAYFNINYGIIILLMTIIIKVVLLPLTYKAYLSTAKMKVLKPEIDELNKKHANDDPLKKQQSLMALYKKAGVSPFGGCIPMLLQFPILIAMFRFFPATIELRQQAFLWADDLSSFDSIYDLGFTIPFYGDHVSLFTLLMTVSTILYTRMNSQMTASPEMAQMKWMMYLMPVIFLGVFNNYASGLSYYYFLANMITFGQQFLFQKFVDQEALLKKIEDNKKKPVSKSGFQKKLEEMAKKRGYNMPK